MSNSEDELVDDILKEGVDKIRLNEIVENVEKGGGEMRTEKKVVPEQSNENTKLDTLNIIFCGHVDAGKSTISGQIMYLTGMVDKRTLEKYEREAREKNRESWYISWIVDTNIEEREKGKTVEVGRASFKTDKKQFIILDAPGHKSFVPNMIGGAAQADVAVLVVSARKGEFETGFDRGGQTREHAMLVKTAGAKHLIVLVNKMDDPTVKWDEERYLKIKKNLGQFLKSCGFAKPKYIPCSGLTGDYLKYPSIIPEAQWYKDECLITYLDELPSMKRSNDAALRIPIVDRYRDMGVIVLGKVESGSVAVNDKILLMPNKTKVEVTNIYLDDVEITKALSGDNIKLKLKGIDESDVQAGNVLCSLANYCAIGKVFDAEVVILNSKSIICPGFSAVLHLQCATKEVSFKAILALKDKKTGKIVKGERPRFIRQDQSAIVRFEVKEGCMCLETYKNFSQLGRFNIRDEDITLGIGKVLKIIE
ncbi:hypothetical protein SNEBB_007776 [Seison nebaliae]|nr:hypothetical protein SNEBB_007776 [Seison nebaliae]